jgi:diacylglycerol O-acyltransferase / wax synthase
MGVSILSYAGQVQYSLITDAALTPDPEAVVSRFSEEFERYLYYVLLDPPPLEADPAARETASHPRLPARGEKESA